MMRRIAPMAMLVLVAAACTYESSGTTTSSAPLPLRPSINLTPRQSPQQ